ncbi:uncharacterized protein VTP21DRAFT_1689 [Calcarisporiella thermophila]|uniref:uncharacterized protein n=1 Tax=Calcarisporiella thermophila TaxID=911321 RepID=UPI0037449C29
MAAINRQLEKLKKSVENGNYYEAHQMYRTVCNRYVKQSKYADAIELLFSGSVTLLKHGQSGSGADLARYLVEAYTGGQIEVNNESRKRIFEILEIMPSEEPGRKIFIQEAIAWSAKFGENPNGDSEFHHFLGNLLWKEKNFQEAERHFLLGTDESGRLLGSLLFEWAEFDNNIVHAANYLAPAVLQQLSIKNIRDAIITFDTFIASWKTKDPNVMQAKSVDYKPAPVDPATKVPLYREPLLNFLQLLLFTVQRDAADMFKTLRNAYQQVLSQEQLYSQLLDRIGETFFGIQPPRNQNLFQDLFSSLLGGGGNIGSGASAARPSGGRPAMELD